VLNHPLFLRCKEPDGEGATLAELSGKFAPRIRWGSSLGVWGLGFGIYSRGLGFRGLHLEFVGVPALGFGIWGLQSWFRVDVSLGLWFRVGKDSSLAGEYEQLGDVHTLFDLSLIAWVVSSC
jgi:hypothetical protein